MEVSLPYITILFKLIIDWFTYSAPLSGDDMEMVKVPPPDTDSFVGVPPYRKVCLCSWVFDLSRLMCVNPTILLPLNMTSTSVCV